ncbi:hypothetical protein BDY24DRAFT_341721 [Mrakia frigida]|uniref:uncharacterized protein n=1 Tax=Mrakia frigida TaxID=29902 RepID=UPI003FCC1088
MKKEGEAEFVLQKIRVHPIKSCRGVELQESAYTSSGLEYDRKWMLVDPTTHKALTAREIPQITIPGSEVIDIPLDPEEKETKTWKLISDVQLFSSTVDGYILPFDQLQKILSAHCSREVVMIMKGPQPRALGSCSSPLLLVHLLRTLSVHLTPYSPAFFLRDAT